MSTSHQLKDVPKPKLGEVVSVLFECGYNPAEALMKAAKKAEELSRDERFDQKDRTAFLALGMKANSELLQYMAPKQKAVEVKVEGEMKHFAVSAEPEASTEEWLEHHKPK